MASNVIEARDLEPGMEIYIMGRPMIVESVTVFENDSALINTTLGTVSIHAARWIKVLS